jgi:ankyrin repeat protein
MTDVDPERQRDLTDAVTAIRTGDLELLPQLLARRPDLVHGDASTGPLLEVATAEGRADVLPALLGAGANPDITFASGDTLIEIARYRGHSDIATLLEKARADLGRVAPSSTHTDHEIHRAAEAGDLRKVRHLLDANPSLVHVGDRAGGTVLHRAVIGRARSVVALLLDRGADIHAVHGAGLGTSSGYAAENLQPIDLAIWGGPPQVRPPLWRIVLGRAKQVMRRRRPFMSRHPCDVAIARLLLARGATYDLPTAAALGDLAHVEAILDADPSRVTETRPNGRRPLSAAATFGHDSIVKLLLQRGSNPTWPDADDSPRGAALHAAAWNGNRGLVELLLAHGADPNAACDASGSATFVARTPEIYAVLTRHGGKLDPYDLVWKGWDDEVMRRVTEDPESANAGCGGVYPAVVTCGRSTLLTRLLDAGVRMPRVAGGCQSYVLERPEMLAQLLARGGLDPDFPAADGRTLLHALCNRDGRNRTMAHRTECAALLVDAGAALSPRDRAYRATPLAWAARNDLPDMVEFLLSRGAPPNLADDEPWTTPLAWAERRGHTRIAEMLRKSGAV